MKKTLALAAVVVAVLAPPGTAHAGDGAPKGSAYGNCGSSSSGGDHTRLLGGAGNGNGGHVTDGKGNTCLTGDDDRDKGRKDRGVDVPPPGGLHLTALRQLPGPGSRLVREPGLSALPGESGSSCRSALKPTGALPK